MESRSITTPLIPSLVLNVADCCNIQCPYCPPYGENLTQGMGHIDTNLAKILIRLAGRNQFKTVRLTGGEPLLFPIQTQDLLDMCGDSFDRLVLNTNGTLLNKYFDILGNYKNSIILKISLDSMDPEEFCYLARGAELVSLINNINAAISLGFTVEINAVLTNQKRDSVIQLIEYFSERKVPVKLLTLSNYYRNVETECSFELDSLVEYLCANSEEIKNEQLDGGRGISMMKFTFNSSIVFLVDHSCNSSKTPMKCYFENCEKSCAIFPCDCGALSISLSTDGLLSACRGNKEYGVNIFGKEEAEISNVFNRYLEFFQNCRFVNVNKII